jgi:hypothetical protein
VRRNFNQVEAKRVETSIHTYILAMGVERKYYFTQEFYCPGFVTSHRESTESQCKAKRVLREEVQPRGGKKGRIFLLSYLLFIVRKISDIFFFLFSGVKDG